MAVETKRVKLECRKCKAPYSILPRTDGKPQRDMCFKCRPRAKGWQVPGQ